MKIQPEKYQKYRSKSHTDSEIERALKKGIPVWKLDTGTDGEDDVLIGEIESVRAEILGFHELEEMREDWTLERVDW